MSGGYIGIFHQRGENKRRQMSLLLLYQCQSNPLSFKTFNQTYQIRIHIFATSSLHRKLVGDRQYLLSSRSDLMVAEQTLHLCLSAMVTMSLTPWLASIPACSECCHKSGVAPNCWNPLQWIPIIDWAKSVHCKGGQPKQLGVINPCPFIPQCIKTLPSSCSKSIID